MTGLSWDSRLTARGVSLQAAIAEPGYDYWRLVAARWFSEQEAGGRGHIYIEALDDQGIRIPGVRVRIGWPSGVAFVHTNGRGGFDAGNFPMSPSRNEFSVEIDEGLPSDRVVGIGMGADTPGGFNAGMHTSTLVVFKRDRFASTPDLPTTPDPVMDALAAAGYALNQAIELYSRQTGG